MKTTFKIAGALFLLTALTACAAGSADAHHMAAGGPLSQALLGFWHGLIAPVTLLVEVINAFAPHTLPWALHLYESSDTGVFYDIGFYLGLAGGPSIVFYRSRRV